MKFLDSNGLAHFWNKIKDWSNSNFFSRRGGEISPEVGLQYIVNGEQLNVFKRGDENETIDIFNVDENGVEAINIVKTGGTATQVLMANGSVKGVGGRNGIAGLDSNGYVPLSQLGNLDTTVVEVVTTLPTTNIKKHIYLVKDVNGVAPNMYNEYIYTGDTSKPYDESKWEIIGAFRATVDLKNYATKSEAVSLNGISLFKDVVSSSQQGQILKQVIKFSNINNAKTASLELENASSNMAGFMSIQDKNKLDRIADGANNYSLPLAGNGRLGGIQVGYAANGRNYPVQLSGEKAYVNVPWTDTNTTYDLTPYAKTADVNAALAKKVDVVSGKGLSTNDFTSAYKSKLDGISSGATADSAISTAEIDKLFA